MNIFLKNPEEAAAKLGFELLGPSGHEELFADINKYIGLQTIDNTVLHRLIQKILKQLEESYTKLQDLAQKNSLTGENRIYIKCPELVDMILTSYLKDDDILSKETPRSLLKKTEIRALYDIIRRSFGAIQQAGATLSIDRYENAIIVVLPYVTQKLEQENKQVEFRYNVSSATYNARRQEAYIQINDLLHRIENRLKDLTQEKYKKEIGGALGWIRSRTKPSREIKIKESTAAIIKKHFPRATGGLPYSVNEVEEYATYLESKLSSLNKEYGCAFVFKTSGSYDEYFHICIQPDRNMDATELIS